MARQQPEAERGASGAIIVFDGVCVLRSGLVRMGVREARQGPAQSGRAAIATISMTMSA